MIEYKFYKIEDYLRINVEIPYGFLGDIFSGNETSKYVQNILDNVNKVKSKELDGYYFGNDAGFSCVVGNEEPEEETESEEGVYVYDAFGDEPEKALFVLPFNELIKLLEEFIVFLKDNDR